MKTKYRAIEKLLYDYKGNQTEVNDINIQIKIIENGYQGVPPISYDEKVDTGDSVSSSVEQEVINKERKIESLEKRKKEVSINTERVENALGFLDELQRNIICYKYLEGLPWFKVAYAVGFSESHTRCIKNQAMNVLKNRMHI